MTRVEIYEAEDLAAYKKKYAEEVVSSCEKKLVQLQREIEAAFSSITPHGLGSFPASEVAEKLSQLGQWEAALQMGKKALAEFVEDYEKQKVLTRKLLDQLT